MHFGFYFVTGFSYFFGGKEAPEPVATVNNKLPRLYTQYIDHKLALDA
jgi:hypothetical protein